MNLRLQEVRKYAGLNKTSFAEKIGLKQFNIRDMESGKQKISVEIADKIGEIFSINPWWLLTGKGEMTLNNASNIQDITGNNNAMINGNKNKTNINNGAALPSTQDEPEHQLIEIPYFEDTYASAGGGALNYKDKPRPMAFDAEFLRSTLGISTFKNLHIINAIGNSMEPTIDEGELLFVNPFENEFNQIKDGGIYVINCNNSVFVKRINHNPITGAVVLLSDNIKVPEIQISGQEFENCIIVGRVVGHFASL